MRLRVVVVNFRHCIVRVCGVLGLLAGGPLHAHEFHGYLTLVSDYVFRGASQSNEDPTVQGGLDYRHPGGVFAGVFAAHTNYPENAFGSNPGSVEFDAYVGYSRTIARDWSWDVAVLHYDFPDSTGIDYSYDELAANLHFRDVLRLGVTASDDAGASRDSGWTAEIEMRRSFGDATRCQVRSDTTGSGGRTGTTTPIGTWAFPRSPARSRSTCATSTRTATRPALPARN